MAAELSRLRKKQSANRNVVQGLITKSKDAMAKGLEESTITDVATYLKTIRSKETVLADVNDKICDLVEEDDIGTTIDDAVKFELLIAADLMLIQNFVFPKTEMKPAVLPIVSPPNVAPAVADVPAPV